MIFAAIAASAAGIAPGPASAQTAAAPAATPATVPVTVFDPRFEPYTVYGTADPSGAVIVFDVNPFDIASGGRAAPAVQAAPAAPSPLPPPLETAAGPAEPAAPARSVETEAGMPAGQGGYVDGVYLANTDYLLSYPLNAYRILSAPVRFDRDDWITAALVVGAGGALFLLDEALMDLWQNDVRGDVTEGMADVFREFGESRTIAIGSIAAYAVAEALDSTGAVDARREKSAALLTLESFVLTQGLVTGLKYVTGRNRPEDTDDAFDFEGPSKGDVNASFPSGHAGSAFAVASVLAETYGPDNPWVPWVAYTVATGTALARVDDNRHWFSDVFVGGAIGYFVGQTVTRYSPFMARNNVTLLPFSRDGARGLSVAYRF